MAKRVKGEMLWVGVTEIKGALLIVISRRKPKKSPKEGDSRGKSRNMER